MPTSLCARSVIAAAISLIAGVAAGLLVPVQSTAAQTGDANAADRNPIVVYTQDATAMQPGGAAQQLRQKATQQGQVRVIVGLRIVTRMEHTLSPSQVDRQRGAQRLVQDAVAARVFGSVSAAGVDRFEFIPYMSMLVDAAQLGRLLADPLVVNVVEDMPFAVNAQEDVPFAPSLSYNIPLIHAPDVWAKGATGTGYVVAMLDSGVAKTHPTLAGKVKPGAEACYSSISAGNHLASLCRGGAESSTAEGSGVNCPLTVAGCDHGTHAASIAAGNTSPDPRLAGVAHDSGIIAIQVSSLNKKTNTATIQTSDLILGLQRVHDLAMQKKFQIASVNLSLAGGKFANAKDCDHAFPGVKLAIDNLRADGIPTVIASGNDGYTGFISEPACISSAIAVGATDETDLIWEESNHSAQVKLMAPGTAIKVAEPPKTGEIVDGTSAAAPHVAGAFALLKQAKPKASLDDILTALSCTGKKVHQRFVVGPPAELAPAKPRIDLLGAYNYLLKPPNVVRSWSFNDPKQALDWTPLLGTWSVAGGHYVQTPIATGWVGTSVANCNNSLQITASMTRVDPGTTLFSNSGIIIKTKIDYPNKQVQGYWFAYNKCPTNSSGDCTGDPKDKPGQAVFWRLDSFSSGTLLCKKQVPVNVNGLNTVKVISLGTSHTYYLNGKLVCTHVSAVYGRGPVMAAAYIAAAGGHAYQLDSFATTSFDKAPAVLAEGEEVMDPAALMPKAIPHGMTPAGSSTQ